MGGPQTFAERLHGILEIEAPAYLATAAVGSADINMSRGEARFNWPETFLKSLVTASSAQMWYQDPRGSADLRATFLVTAAETVGALDRLDIRNVLITSGAKQALWLAFQAAVKTGDRVLLPCPGWSPYAVWTRALGGEVSLYDSCDPEARSMIHEIRRNSASHVVINSPNNPTGIEYRQGVIDIIAASARKTGTVVISDEVYRCFSTENGSFLAYADAKSRQVIVVDSLSKAAGAAGLRVGFLVAGRDTIDAAAIVRGTVDSCSPGICQSVGTLLLAPSARQFRDDIRRFARATVEKLVDVLAAESIPVESSGALYAWIPAGATDGGVKLSDGRVLRGIPGSTFGKPGYVRLCPVSDGADCVALLGVGSPSLEGHR